MAAPTNKITRPRINVAINTHSFLSSLNPSREVQNLRKLSASASLFRSLRSAPRLCILCRRCIHSLLFRAAFPPGDRDLLRRSYGRNRRVGLKRDLRLRFPGISAKENRFLAKEPLKFRSPTASIIHVRSEFVKGVRKNLCIICEQPRINCLFQPVITAIPLILRAFLTNIWLNNCAKCQVVLLFLRAPSHSISAKSGACSRKQTPGC